MMLKMLRSCITNSSPIFTSHPDFLNPIIIESSQVRFRRRTMVAPPWIPPQYKPIYRELSKEDRELAEILLNDDSEWRRNTKPAWSNIPTLPGLLPPDCTKNIYSENSKRIGLIGRKIGMTLQWLKNGTRLLCTMIHIPDNHVISALDPDTWFRRSSVGKKKAFGKNGQFWSQMVGAINHDSPFYTDVYRRIFERVGIPYKKRMANFLVTEDAIVKPGTHLDVQHFKVGQFVTISGKTIDWGFQGAMHRWGFKGMPRLNTTKSHRRVGSIGSKSDAKVWPGKRMPGHMGYEWRRTAGLEVLRINPLKQVLYVKGCISGDIDELVLINDCMIEDKRTNDLPFPTYYSPFERLQQHQNLQQEIQTNDSDLNEIYAITSHDIYHPNLFQFTQPTIVYTEADETKSPIRDKAHAKIAKAKKAQ